MLVAHDVARANIEYATDINSQSPVSLAVTLNRGLRCLAGRTVNSVNSISIAGSRSSYPCTTVAGLLTGPRVTVDSQLVIPPGQTVYLGGQLTAATATQDMQLHDYFQSTTNSAVSNLNLSGIVKGFSLNTTLSGGTGVIFKWRRKTVACRTVLRPVIALGNRIGTATYIDMTTLPGTLDMEENVQYYLTALAAGTYDSLFIGLNNPGMDTISGIFEVDLVLLSTATTASNFSGSMAFPATPAHLQIVQCSFASTWPVVGARVINRAMILSAIDNLVTIEGTVAGQIVPGATRFEGLQERSSWYDTIASSTMMQHYEGALVGGEYCFEMCTNDAIVFTDSDIASTNEMAIFVASSANSTQMLWQMAVHVAGIPISAASRAFDIKRCYPRANASEALYDMVGALEPRISGNTNEHISTGKNFISKSAGLFARNPHLWDAVGDIAGTVSPRAENAIHAVGDAVEIIETARGLQTPAPAPTDYQDEYVVLERPPPQRRTQRRSGGAPRPRQPQPQRQRRPRPTRQRNSRNQMVVRRQARQPRRRNPRPRRYR